MKEDIFKEYPYDIIFQEEMDALPLSSDLLGLSKLKSQQSKIISVFDDSITVAEKSGEIKTLKKSSLVYIVYGVLAIIFVFGLIFINSYRSFQGTDYLFVVFVLLAVTFLIYKAFDKGTVIKNYEDRIIVNDTYDYSKINIKDILLVNRPQGSSGERSYIILICKDNTYDRHDFTDISEVQAIRAFRKWFLRQ